MRDLDITFEETPWELTLTMEKKIGNTIVVFLAEFERDQEEALKNIKVGDEITFEGTCYSAGSWSDCELIN